jgi:glycosyltransferase involved in cell wall biosynthesis
LKPQVSICVINKNTETTIERSLRSVLVQLNEDYEVVIVDESTDGSIEIIKRLMVEYPNRIRLILLSKNSQRGIGFARNVSIKEAKGDYCVMHIDCDDVWQPHISDFCSVFFQIESALGSQFLLAGHQINMARREFLLTLGPYREVEHGEDRDLWMRLAKRDQYIPIDHVAFFSRLPLSRSVNIGKALRRTIWGVRDEVRKGSRIGQYFSDLSIKKGSLAWNLRLARLLIYPYARFTSLLLSKFDPNDYFMNVSEWNDYKARNFGTFREIAKLRGFSGELDFFKSDLAKAIFSRRRGEISYEQLVDELATTNFDGKLSRNDSK